MRNMVPRAALAVVLLLGFGISAIRAEDAPTHGFLNRVYKDDADKERKYVVFVPADYKGDKPYPLILFLHGSGETNNGKNIGSQAVVGLGKAIRENEKTFPFIAVFPQYQAFTTDGNHAENKVVLAILDTVEKDFKVDPKRVYLTGLSMGGANTWSLAAKVPERWAAIVPVCGFGDPKTAEKIKNIPCWCFHGDADKAVNIEKSREMIAALKAAGADPKFTEYPGVGHNSWDKAYATKELYDWLLAQHLK